ncbi:MAG: ATP-grasp domain-containing protein [Chloroflexi bacterium]|nr:ATP-grasp domain-containing protein [Ardenticatenaceae bacterium]MBL1130377.1 ATP-grasp domain-containing protein [Chloroflexota bacterium]NOG36467.1 ATP-grasp domain-containing protein [Chloroflexota bacterium]
MSPSGTILLLTTPHTYRAEAFVAAAKRLAVPLVTAVDLPPELARRWPGRLALDFQQPETAVQTILDFAQTTPLAAILPVDDSGVLIAACANQALGLPHNQPAAAAAARDKLVMRQFLHDGGVPTPPFHGFELDDTVEMVTAVVQAAIGFPCVVKPRTLNGSRGVIRANDATTLAMAVRRLQRLLQSIGAAGFLVEGYLPGVEVALEAVLDHGRLQPLALFDKPDPLEGPFFEETIYVTPSRLPMEAQTAVIEMAAQGARAIGLQTGAVHAELRLNEKGAWIVEVNGRSIGGLCSQTLRFDVGMSLEELLLRQAVGLDVRGLQRQPQASGVMMIPIPRPGILRRVEGLDAAQAVPGIDEIAITVPDHHRLVPLPEGESYLGFIFATGQTPDVVEEALRLAHGRLQFIIDEEIPLLIR